MIAHFINRTFIFFEKFGVFIEIKINEIKIGWPFSFRQNFKIDHHFTKDVKTGSAYKFKWIKTNLVYQDKNLKHT